MMTSTTAPPACVGSSPVPRVQARFAAVAAVMLAAAAPIYLPVVVGLMRQWYEDPNSSYGCMVAIAAVVSLRQRWRRLRSLPIEGSWWAAAGLVPAALLYAIATLAADVFLLRSSLAIFCAAAVWFVCGSAHVRTLAPTLALCLAAIPLPTALVTELTLPLQLAASQLATVLLGLMSIDVVRDGNVLTLSYITLEVAEACSGMRSVVTLLALVAVYWGIRGAALARILPLAAATIPVALAGNGLRVAATALLASRLGADATRGVVHDATGLATFVLMCAALGGVHLAASRPSRRSPAKADRRRAAGMAS
jgi:exosortase